MDRHTRFTVAKPLSATLAVALLLATVLFAGCSALGFGERGTTGTPTMSPGAPAGGAAAPEGSAAQQPNYADTQSKLAARPDVGAQDAQSQAGGSPSGTVARMVVRDATLRERVKEVAATARKVAALAGAAGGYVESMQLATDRGGTVTPPVVPLAGGVSPDTSVQSDTPLAGYVRVRVPAARLSAFVRDASRLGEVLFQSTNAQDVTAQHVDMVARLANLKSTEAGLRRLMAKANTVAEVLAVQRELTRVQGEIESLTAQLKALEDQAAMSAVTVELVGPEQVVSSGGDDWGFLTALRDSLRAFAMTTNAIIVMVGGLGPIIIIIALVALLIVLLVRRQRRRRAEDAAAEAPAEGEVEDGPPLTEAGHDDPGRDA